MGSLSEKKIIEKSKEYYSKPENVRKKWFDQYGKISADNNYYDNKKCIDEVFNLVDVVMDLKLDEFRMEAYRLPDDIIDNKVNEVYLYKGQKITFWPTTSFLSKVIALRKTGYKISTDLDKKIRVIRNATTHGNATILNENIKLDHVMTKDILVSLAEALIVLGILSEEDKEPDFEKLRVRKGDLLRGGEYVVGEFIGEGGMSRVYSSFHKRLGKRLAIKELKPGKYSESLIKNECSVMTTLKNDGIPQIFDTFAENGTYYIVMEFVTGETLDIYLKKNTLSDAQRFEMARKLCDVVGYLHKSGIIHADIKPQNIIVREDNKICLIDFGISDSGTGSRVEGAVSEGYSAPERYTDIGGKGSDIYSLGMVLKDIFSSDSKENGSVNEVIEKCISYNPENRYKDTEELKSAVDEAASKDSEKFAYANNTHKKSSKRYIAIAAGIGAVAAAIIIPLAVIKRPSADANIQTGGANASTAAEFNSSKEQNDVLTDEELKGQAAELFEKACSIVKNEDRDGLNALFIRSEDTQAEIDKFYNKVKEYNEKDYEETSFYNICSSENHHGVGVFSWEVYSGHPDDNYLANSFFLTLSPSEDGWKLDETNETAVLLGESDDIKKIWTSEMINAVNEGRNYHIFDTEDYTWNERYITIPGVFSKQGCIMWQEEDGTVILKLNFKNGTDKVMKLNSLNVTAQDSRLGTIFENIGVKIESGYVDEIEPGESKNMDLTINSDYILTAEDTWSDDIRLDIDAEYAE